VLADTIAGGLGADITPSDVAGGADIVDAGGTGEGNLLLLTGDAGSTFHVDLSVAPGAISSPT